MTKHLLLTVFIILSSCVSKEYCENTDWQGKGFAEGREGSQGSLTLMEGGCQKKGVSIRDAYMRGYSEGIKAYCTQANGLYVGSRGDQYQRQCPPELEKDFLPGYYEGQRTYERNRVEQEKADAIRAAVTAPQPVIVQPVQVVPVRTCSWNSDCTVRRTCAFSRCQGTNQPCTWDSDCTINGVCRYSRCSY